MNRFTLFLLSMAIAIGTLTLHQTGRLTPLTDGAATIFVLVQQPFAGFMQGFGGMFEGVTTLNSMREENAQLRAQVDELTREVAMLRSTAEEVQRLRERLGFQEQSPNLNLLAADIVGWSPISVNQMLTINRGSADGVEEGMTVIASRGLVGRVVKAGINHARVLLVIDANSAVNAVVRSRQQEEQNLPGSATGIVQGQGVTNPQLGNMLVMRYLQQTEQVQVGDTVYTSGIGANYMKGIAIGRIKAVKRSDVESFQEAIIEPHVDFSRLDHVFIVLNFKPTRLD